ncbi:hypothetical protein OKJ48_35680 [Streptomyces kunmingensis]|uniref:Uncharacterized protein n=1 Tax=Streptomyces kunmingensis TaxID=68225 RepID=A0ABU6CLE5_9ACTN|nr:hypothetical protein [Streptomyces kunmingensis]MEB3965531.1 hypothetical protein [Streptomyces kunmingensis]
MSLNNDLTVIQRCVDELARAVSRLQPELTGPDLRRVRADTDHLRESVALLRASAAPPGHPDPPRPQGLVPIPDTPYDSTLWTDSDDEGLGARNRHAP